MPYQFLKLIVLSLCLSLVLSAVGCAGESKTDEITPVATQTVPLLPYLNNSAITAGNFRGNLDGVGYGFSQNIFPAEGETLICPVNTVKFIRPTKNEQGFDNIECQKQELKLPQGKFKNIHFLACAHNGNQKGFFKIKYSDDTEVKIFLEADDWWNKPLHGYVFSESLNTKDGKLSDHKVYVSNVRVICDNTKELSSLILPKNDKIHIFAISVTEEDVPVEPCINQIEVNTLGYKPGDRKIAVVSLVKKLGQSKPIFKISKADDQKNIAFDGELEYWGKKWNKEIYLADFSPLKTTGRYTIKFNDISSPAFLIDQSLYSLKINTSNIFDSFFKTQRCVEENIPEEVRKDGALTHKDIDTYLPMFKIDKRGKEIKLKAAFIDALGGWHDATSTDKETVKIAWTAQMLLLAYENNSPLFEMHKANGLPQVLDEAKWGLDYLLKIQDEDGGVFLAVKPHDWWNSESPPRRFLANKGTGVTARVVSAWMTGHRIFKDKDSEVANRYLEAAKRGWEFIENNPNDYITQTMYPGYWTGNASHITWAAVESYFSLKDADPQTAQGYLEKAMNDIKKGSFKNGIWNMFDIKEAAAKSSSDTETLLDEQIAIALAKVYQIAEGDLKDKIRQDLYDFFNYWVKKQNAPYQIPEHLITNYFGMNGWMVELAMNMLVVGQALNDHKIIQYGKDQMNWVLGTNPFGKSFVVGVGSIYYEDPFSRKIENSIGGVLPGIMDADNDNIPEDMGLYDWQVRECCLDYSGALVYNISLLDKLM